VIAEADDSGSPSWVGLVRSFLPSSAGGWYVILALLLLLFMWKK
jgi:hypothetical protein